MSICSKIIKVVTQEAENHREIAEAWIYVLSEI